MATTGETKWLRATIALAVAAISATAAFSVCFLKRKSRHLHLKVRELEISLKASSEKCVAERQGRIRAQQALRKALVPHDSDSSELTSYPMAPIAIIQSCFSTRNGTPRQPLLVPLSRACLVFDSSRVPPAALEGLGEYSHCWIIYVFHLNTNLEKIWKHPSKPKFKAKVRVPRLKGGRMGVFATRSPHRPCPIGLTVAKIEAVQGHIILLSGVDLVDGTPVLDVKPYLPYCDSIQGATVPEWITVDNILAVTSIDFSKDFSSSLSNCWVTVEKKSLYASPDEFQSLIKQVLSWDIRSISQRNRLCNAVLKTQNHIAGDHTSDLEEDEVSGQGIEQVPLPSSNDIIYHLTLEVLDISYRINSDGNVVVEKAALSSYVSKTSRNRCNYTFWRDKLG